MPDMPSSFKCPQCGAPLRIGRHYCNSCGAKVDVQFDEIERAVEVDKAAVAGDAIGGWARTGLTSMLILAVAIFAVKDCYGPRRFPADPNDSITLLPPNVQSTAVYKPQVVQAQYNLRSPAESSTGTRPWPFAYRLDPDYRRAAVTARGGDYDKVEAIVTNGLAMLASEQQEDGSFPVRLYAARNRNRRIHWYPTGSDWEARVKQGAVNDCTPVGATALAALCFLGHGDVDIPQSTGLTHYGEISNKAIKWLVLQQDPATGAFGKKDAKWTVNHAQATMALIEYCGLTRDKDNLQGNCDKAIDFLLTCADAKEGGFAYQPGAGLPANLEATAWSLMALTAAREAGMIDTGLPEDKTRDDMLQIIYGKTVRMLSDLRTIHGNVAFDQNQLGQAGDVRDWLGMYLSSVEILSNSDNGKPLDEVVANFTAPQYNSNWLSPWEMNKDAARDQAPGRAQELRPNDYFFATMGLRYYGGKAWTDWQKLMVPVLGQWQDPNDHSFRANDDLSISRGLVWSTSLDVLAAEAYYLIP